MPRQENSAIISGRIGPPSEARTPFKEAELGGYVLSDTELEEIVSLRRDHRLSLAVIGKRFTPPLSAERVRQILKQRGLDSSRTQREVELDDNKAGTSNV